MRIFEDLPSELCQRLHTLSLDEAISEGLIDDIGDEEGNFIFEDPESPGKFFAIVQKCKVLCSERLIEDYSPEEITKIIGDLSFFRWVSDGKEHFRLARPRYIKLGEAAVSIKIEEKESTADYPSIQHINFHPKNAAPKNPKQGMIYYDKQTNCLRCFDGISWKSCW